MELLKLLHEWEVGIGLFQGLQELNVSFCRLIEWPNHIDKIPSLQMLNFGGNQIDSVPKVLGVHTTLKYLDLSENKLLILPMDFYSLTQIQVPNSSYFSLILTLCFLLLSHPQTLILHHNAFYQLPDQKNRPRIASLSTIDLSHNKFTVFDGTFNVFPRLLHLNLSHNEINEIQPSIGQLMFLQTLNFNSNQISSLPDKLSSCVALHTLAVNHNCLVEFPSCIPHLLNLKSLDLSHNQLQSPRPTYFSTLLKIIELDLSNNQLTTLPNSLFTLHKLVKLTLSHNLIPSLSSEFLAKLTSLQFFDLSFNCLQALPIEIHQLSALTELNLRNNLLETLPESLGTMTQLKTLYLTNNLLTEYPEKIFTKIQKLSSWNVSNNQILGCYGEFLKSIESDDKEDDEEEEELREEREGGEERDEGRAHKKNEPMKIESIKRKNHKLFVELEQDIFQRNIAQDQLILLNSSFNETTAKIQRESERRRVREFYAHLTESVLYLQEERSVHPPMKEHGMNSKSFWKTISQKGQIPQSTAKLGNAINPLSPTIFPDDLLDTLDIGKEFLKYIHKYESLVEKIRQFHDRNNADRLARKNSETKKGPLSNTHNRDVIHHQATIQEQYEVAMDSEVDKLLQESRSIKGAFRLSMSSKGTEDTFQLKLEQLKGSQRHAVVEEDVSFEGEVSIKSHQSQAQSLHSDNRSQVSSHHSRPRNVDHSIGHQGSNASLQSANSSQQHPVLAPSIASNSLHHQSRNSNASTSLHHLPVDQSPRQSFSSEPPHTDQVRPSQYSWKFSDLLSDPFLGNPNDSEVYYQVIESYYGLSLALNEIGDCIASDIRKIEKVNQWESKLKLNHRRGIDFMDLMPGYEHFFPRSDPGASARAVEMRRQESKEMKPTNPLPFFSLGELDFTNDLESELNSRPSTSEGGARPSTTEDSRPGTAGQLATLPSFDERRDSRLWSRRKSTSRVGRSGLIP
jgi:Leucine-rich repeat (LRR) protein